MAKLLKNMPFVALTTNIVMNGMNSENNYKKNEDKVKQSNNLFENIKSKIILKRIFDNLQKKKKLLINKYNYYSAIYVSI